MGSAGLERGFALARTPMGMMIAPVKDGQPMTPEQFAAEEARELDSADPAAQQLLATWRLAASPRSPTFITGSTGLPFAASARNFV